MAMTNNDNDDDDDEEDDDDDEPWQNEIYLPPSPLPRPPLLPFSMQDKKTTFSLIILF